jgi:hypothetical protein
MLIDRIGAGLNDKYICPANVFQNLKIDFAVTEATEVRAANRDSQIAANAARELRVTASGKNLELLVDQVASPSY